MEHSASRPGSALPSARKIRRSCQNELYRTIKRMKIWIPEDKLSAAETFYYKKVIGHLVWIHENRAHRSKQADWWEENVSLELSSILSVDHAKFVKAFREAYGG